MNLNFYITRMLFRYHICDLNDNDIEIIDIIRTQGNVGVYVKYNLIYHFTGFILISKDCFITNELIFKEFDIQTTFDNERKKKLKFLKLNEEYNLNK